MTSSIEPEELRRFVARTEDTVVPKQVAKLYAHAEMLGQLPLAAQRWIISHAGGDPYMGFVVEPYCLFLAYEIDDLAAASTLLPPGYTLVPTSMYADGEPRHCSILGAFTVHTSVFWGGRVEQYLIAEHADTGMLTWVICDYESNTISYDPGQGFTGATTSRAVITTTHAGEVLVDVRSKERPNRLTVTVPLAGAAMRALDQRLWIDGNLSVDYGGELRHESSEPFGLVFDPAEMTQALDVPLDHVTVEQNTFGSAFSAAEPFEVACFPYAQHFLTSSYPRASAVRDQAALEEAVRGHAAESS